MVVVDLIVVGVLLAAAALGFRQGLNAAALALIGFGVGAIIGSRLAPLALESGYEDTFAPAVALPAGLLLGAIFAAAFERLGFRLRRHVRLRGKVNAVGGALLAACLGLVGVWILAALAARSSEVRPDVRDSAIIERLNAVLPPPGPLLRPEKRRRLDPLPQMTGPAPNIGPADPRIKNARRIRAAAPSVVKIRKSGCAGGGTGSGWIARDGIVVTNAHVVQDAQHVAVQPRGKGEHHAGDVIWFDPKNDIAVVRVPGVSGVPALRLGAEPKAGTYAAALGFPGGGPYTVKPGRTGEPTRHPGLEVDGKPIRVKITPFRAIGAGPGSSGGPIVDRRGHVRTMVFAGRTGTSVGYGVPTTGIRRALRRAGPSVDHGECP